jgi:hypothetical protein
MSSLKKGDVIIAPQVDNEYLTSGKEYTIEKVFVDDSFIIRDDNKKKLNCRLTQDGHLNGLDWEFKK